MSKHFSFVALVVGMLVLFSCQTVDTLEMMDGRMHNVQRTTFCGVPVHTQAEVVKTDAELEQEAKEATSALKMELERKLELAEADADAAKFATKEFETWVGSCTKLCGWALVALGVVGHCFVSGSTLRSIASSTIASGYGIMLVGILVKKGASWEAWLAIVGSAIVIVPTLYLLRKKGLGKATAPKDEDDERVDERRKRMAP